ncbi:MAG: sulfatase [Planctomycetaceae bacterium]|nr:sulfatase [Planctomycetaceae bacterium]
MRRCSFCVLLVVVGSTLAAAAEKPRPNILWITSEDNGPHLGCYGTDYATTPNLDALAERGMIYRACWSTAPVCAPARTTIISGMYPPSLGAQHMRSMTRLPYAFKMYPQYLREAGYFCTNKSKEDYNLEKPGQVWDKPNHWKNRKPGQPFFAIFNHTTSHESKLRTRPHKQVQDPAQVRVPAYHPDTPEVRQDWAQYYDRLTEMDALAGENLREIEEAGLAEDTIVFYYGDHGSGMPRNKRWTYNSGLHVPLIVYIPEKFKHLRPDDYLEDGETDRLVGFVDLAPTLLSLCGIKPPEHMQGYAFAGEYATEPQPYIYGFRDRMDERFDMVRSIRDLRFIYIRNYMPHKAYGQYIAYMFQTPTTRVWKQMFDDGKLNQAQSAFWREKPAEELYDLQEDPDEVHNLAASAEHRAILKKLRKAQQDLARDIKDVGFLPEGEIHSRSAGSTPYEMGHDSSKYPFDRIMAVAEQASSIGSSEPKFLEELMQALQDKDSAVRYWGVMGLLMRKQIGVSSSRDLLHRALEDESPYVRIAAAEALGRYGNKVDIAKAVPVLLELAPADKNGIFASMYAVNALDFLDGNAAGVVDQIRKLPTKDPKANGRMKSYVTNLIRKTLADLK